MEIVGSMKTLLVGDLDKIWSNQSITGQSPGRETGPNWDTLTDAGTSTTSVIILVKWINLQSCDLPAES